MASFCRNVCGTCDPCLAGRAEVDRLDAILSSLSDEDLRSLHHKRPDTPYDEPYDDTVCAGCGAKLPDVEPVPVDTWHFYGYCHKGCAERDSQWDGTGPCVTPGGER